MSRHGRDLLHFRDDRLLKHALVTTSGRKRGNCHQVDDVIFVNLMGYLELAQMPDKSDCRVILLHLDLSKFYSYEYFARQNRDPFWHEQIASHYISNEIPGARAIATFYRWVFSIRAAGSWMDLSGFGKVSVTTVLCDHRTVLLRKRRRDPSLVRGSGSGWQNAATCKLYGESTIQKRNYSDLYAGWQLFLDEQNRPEMERYLSLYDQRLNTYLSGLDVGGDSVDLHFLVG